MGVVGVEDMPAGINKWTATITGILGALMLLVTLIAKCRDSYLKWNEKSQHRPRSHHKKRPSDD